MRRHEPTDKEWAIIAPLLPNKPRGVAGVDDLQHGAAIRKGAMTIAAWTLLEWVDYQDPRSGRCRGSSDPPPAHRRAGGDAPAGHELPARLAPGHPSRDKAYDTDAIRAETAERGGSANVPPRTIRKRTFAFSRWLYRQRNHVERFFNQIKQMRGLATRYDRRPEPATVRIWINA